MGTVGDGVGPKDPHALSAVSRWPDDQNGSPCCHGVGVRVMLGTVTGSVLSRGGMRVSRERIVRGKVGWFLFGVWGVVGFVKCLKLYGFGKRFL